MEIDVKQNRNTRQYSSREMIGRFLWSSLGVFLFRIFPSPYTWGWRSYILTIFGSSIGTGVRISKHARIECPWNLSLKDYVAIGNRVNLYCLGPVVIGERTAISQDSVICAGTHDWKIASFPLIKSKIEIGSNVWVGSNAFIGPGVVINNGAIIGAAAVITKDVKKNSIMVGNPAKSIGAR